MKEKDRGRFCVIGPVGVRALGENDGNTVDPRGSVQLPSMLTLAISIPRYSILPTPFQPSRLDQRRAPGSVTRATLGPQGTRKITKTSRSNLNSLIVEMQSPVTGSMGVPNHFNSPLFQATNLDGVPADRASKPIWRSRIVIALTGRTFTRELRRLPEENRIK